MTALGATIHTLAGVASRPETTIRNRLSAVRRLARIFHDRMELIIGECRVIRREAAKLKEHLPFTQHRIEQLIQKAHDHRAGELEHARLVLEELGYVTIHDQTPGLETLTLSDFAALLNINAVELEQARKDGVYKLSDIAFVQKLEDSASLRKTDWGGGPLFQACWLAMAKHIQTAPLSELPDPFAPGAPFGPALPPDLKVVPGGRPEAAEPVESIEIEEKNA